MDHAGGMTVTLVGGKLDGDTIVIMPNGSLGPPQNLSYLDVVHKDGPDDYTGEACWLVYGIPFDMLFSTQGDWPHDDTKVEYHFIGRFSIDYSRKL